ncbi:MAG: RNA-binding S4 domain-containing protein [Bacteroidales bacterium]|nr:MAG: RNA-binding S4 domain-containing protein [Bacteroidales bacterium]
MTEENLRIDKWLWAVRIFKTRNQASEACKKGRVIIGGIQVKSSRVVKTGEVILIRKPPVVYTYKVKGLLQRRQSAKIAREYYDDLTSVEELNKLQIKEKLFFSREKGSGRPTKKERRILDKLRGD